MLTCSCDYIFCDVITTTIKGIPTINMRHDHAVKNLTSLIVGAPCRLLVSRVPTVNQDIVTIKVYRSLDGLGFSVIGGTP